MPKRFRDLTRAQEAAFECIALNGQPQCAPRTLKALEDAGLIAKDVHQLDGWPPVWVNVWYVPIRVHMEWCQWCSKALAG